MLNTASARIAVAVTALHTNLQELREEDREGGQALVEYALILALIAVVCIAAMVALQGGVSAKFTEITGKLK